MIPATLSKESGSTVHCMTNKVLLFDGCGTHTTLGYLLPEYGPVFRQVFDAALALLPEGSHFVPGTKINYSVLPCESISKAHSYMIDLNRSFIHNEYQFAQWVGEFYPAFDLVRFIETVWDVALNRVKRMVHDGKIIHTHWPRLTMS